MLWWHVLPRELLHGRHPLPGTLHASIWKLLCKLYRHGSGEFPCWEGIFERHQLVHGRGECFRAECVCERELMYL
jgi:hypothetical protein